MSERKRNEGDPSLQFANNGKDGGMDEMRHSSPSS
jgi:hypothetical protein